MNGPFYNQHNFGAQFAPITNKTFVNSLQDALNRWSDYNSEMIYFDWYKDVAYNVITNGRGEKTYEIIYLSKHQEPATEPVPTPKVETSKTDVLEEKVDKLTKLVEDLYGKYNAKQASVPATGNE